MVVGWSQVCVGRDGERGGGGWLCVLLGSIVVSCLSCNTETLPEHFVANTFFINTSGLNMFHCFLC